MHHKQEIKSQENFSLTSIERENLLSGEGMAPFNSNDISEALDEASDYVSDKYPRASQVFRDDTCVQSNEFVERFL